MMKFFYFVTKFLQKKVVGIKNNSYLCSGILKTDFYA